VSPPFPEHGVDPLLVGGDLQGLLSHHLAGVDDGGVGGGVPVSVREGVGGGVPVSIREGVVRSGVGFTTVRHLSNA